MTRPIKFRQRIDNQFHYWGIIDGKYVSPVESSSGENPATTHHDEFTGLHDKNGKEIWEGDVLAFGKTKERLEVKWGKRGFVHVMWPELSEVIGNVWENTDLLK